MSDVQFDISLDPSEYLKGVHLIKEGMATLVEENQSMNKSIADAASIANKANADLAKTLVDTTKVIEEQKKSAKATSDTLKNYGTDLQQNIRILIDNKKALQDIQNQHKELNKTLDQGRISQEQYQKKAAVLVEQEAQLKVAISEVTAQITAQSKANNAAAGSYEQMTAKLQQLKQIFRQLSTEDLKGEIGSALLANAKEIDPTIDGFDSLTGSFTKMQPEVKSFVQDFNTAIVVLKKAKSELIAQQAALAPTSKEYQILGSQVENLSLVLDGADSKLLKSREAIMTLTNVSDNLEQALGKDSNAFKTISNLTGQYADKITDLRTRLKNLGSDTRGIDGLLQGAQALTGVFGIAVAGAELFGDKNEDLQKSMQRLQAVMTIVVSVQQVVNGLQKESALVLLLQDARTKALAAGQYLYTIATNVATSATAAFTAALAATGIGTVLVLLGLLTSRMANYGDETDDAADKQKKLNDQLKENKQLLGELADKGLEERNARKGGLNDLERQLKLEEAKGTNDKKVAALKQQVYDAEIRNLNYLKATYGDYSEEVLKYEQQILDKKTDKVVTEIELNKKLSDEQKKRATEQKALADEITKFIQNEEKLRFETIQDSQQRQYGEIVAGFENELNALGDAYKKIIETQRLSEEDKKRLQESFDNQRAEISAKYALKAIDLEKQTAEEKKRIVDEANKAILEVQGTAQQKEVAQVEEKYQQITATIKAAGQLNAATEKEIADKQAKEISDINQKYGLDKLTKQQDIEEALINATKRTYGTAAFAEEEKQKKILQVQLDYGKKRLAVLEATGGEENKVAIAQTKALVSKLEETIDEGTKGENPLAKLLGVTEGELDEALSAVEGGVNKMLDVITAGTQRRIDEKQREIDAISDRIDDEEDALNREMALADKGYAHNVSGKQKELDLLKAQREKDLKEQQDLQKEQARIEAAKQVAAFGTSTANMAVTASQVIKSASEQGGWVGALIGIGLAAGIIAQFIGMVNSLKATKFADGGEIKGAKHSGGGEKYVSVNGSSSGVMELEDGEYVVNANSTSKYKPVIEAINKDELSRWTYDDLMRYVSPSDVQFKKTVPKKIVKLSHEVNSQANPDDYLKDIAETNRNIANSNKALLDNEVNREEIVETDEQKIIKKGNHTRIIKKHRNEP